MICQFLFVVTSVAFLVEGSDICAGPAEEIVHDSEDLIGNFCEENQGSLKFFYDQQSNQCDSHCTPSSSELNKETQMLMDHGFLEIEDCEKFCVKNDEQNDTTTQITESVNETLAEVITVLPLDKCGGVKDFTIFCDNLRFVYYYDVIDNQCRPFHSCGFGFETIEECENQCLKTNEPVDSTAFTGPIALTEINAVSPSDKDYLKSDQFHLAEGNCVGFLYNISREGIRLFSYFCDVEAGGHCILEVFASTQGEERCQKFHSWLRGTHAYSVYFTLTAQEKSANDTVSLTDFVVGSEIFVEPCQNVCKNEM